MLKKVLALIGVLMVLFLAYTAFENPNYVITRKVAVNAPAEKIFPYLNNMKLAEQWGPWKEVDPNSKMSHSGPDEGVGAKTSWEGGKQLGVGSATIVGTTPNQKVEIKLEYTAPMAMTQDSEYWIEPAGAINLVHWTVRGQNSFMGRLMCHFFNMDKMVGGMFEKGLSNLKAIAEKPTESVNPAQ